MSFYSPSSLHRTYYFVFGRHSMTRLQQAEGRGSLCVCLHSARCTHSHTCTHRNTSPADRRQSPFVSDWDYSFQQQQSKADMKAIWISVIKHVTEDAPGYASGKTEMFQHSF